MAPLTGKVALVTGGAGGLGRAICQGLAAAGASVVVGYHRSADAAETFAAGLPRASNDAEHAAMAAPVTDSAALHDLAARLDRKYGRCFSPRSSARTGFSCTRCSRENSSSATPSTTSAATPRAG